MSDVQVGATTVSPVSLREAVIRIATLVHSGDHHLVVTPNVDHLVILERDAEFADAYARATLRVADGAPLMLLARLCRSPLPERVTGVDLATALLEAAEHRGFSVYFLGGAPRVLDAAVVNVRARWPRLKIVGTAAPMIDLDGSRPEAAAAVGEIQRTQPDLLFLFLGAPKQEKWFWRNATQLPPTVALGLGGAVEILAGTKRRPPQWAQSAGLEWCWRMFQDPKRLLHRYLVRDLAFVGIAARQVAGR